MALERDSLPTKSYPAEADFALEVIIDRGTGYLADGADTFYYTAVRVPHPETWQEVAEDIAGEDELLSFNVRAVWQGRYWDVDDAQTTVVWTSRKVRDG